MLKKKLTKNVYDCSSHDLLNVVADVESYAEFIPFCYDAKIHEKKNINNSLKIIADLTIGKGPFKDTYKSDVEFNKKDNCIHVTNIDGPLNHLSNKWSFIQQNNQTEVTFDIDFEIKNKFLNTIMEASFKFGLEKIANAFQKRAEKLFSDTKN